ncbi:hypothetical protein [Geobacter sp. SVR]|uniref:hypothetical protein n=1 Tax=Geobacter sp. SVR TaxID=2495594 RepID=UPI00143F0025|nr:hypothetical protein [Geobacter sp. SVR]BCS55868.1 hypothetical protein GSVR_41760 [Geobacter sp. SVR]GCF83872.1 hypothetical protein GSbR_04720 [Geobacter sp. SVR]
MQIERTGSTELTITGNIKSIEDSIQIKEAIGTLCNAGGRSLHLQIPDSFSMTSTVIGNLMKLVHHDKIQLSIAIGDQRLYELLDELNLVKAFNARMT